MPRTQSLFVSTSKLCSTLTAGSLVAVSPQTGAVNASLRVAADLSGKTPIGVSKVSLFPSQYSSEDSRLAICVGGSAQKKDDTYAMLVLLRSSALSPICFWKSRLPEPQLTASLIASPCGTYIVGGGASGTLYLWMSIGGTLLRTTKAHFRAINVIVFTSCGKFLMTGGADGMIHLFSLMGLATDDEQNNSQTTVRPIRTWNCHQLEITSLVTLSGNSRVASTSADGNLMILELSSENVLCSIGFNRPIMALASLNNRIFVGTTSGTVHLVDLDEYAIHQTEKLDGVRVVRNHLDNVFDTAATRYTVNLSGHEGSILSLCAWTTMDGRSYLASGDSLGQIRIWDLESRNCTKIIHPWSSTTAVGTTNPNSSPTTIQNPVSCMELVELYEEEKALFEGSQGKRGTKEKTIASSITPLQKFVATDRHSLARPVPFLKRREDDDEFWNVTNETNWAYYSEALEHRRRKKRVRQTCTSSSSDITIESLKEKVRQLQEELSEAHEAVGR